MTRHYTVVVTEINVTELRHRLLELIRQVEAGGEEVTVLRHGRRVARIVPATSAPAGQFGIDAGRVRIVDETDDLLSTGETWDAST